MKTTAIAPWYGSNRSLAENVGRLLNARPACRWVAVPFAGGMCELAHRPSTIHQRPAPPRHHLASVVADPGGGPSSSNLRRVIFHPTSAELNSVRDYENWDSARPPKTTASGGRPILVPVPTA